ncbi:MAG: hypothetical protein F4230_07770 [Holophagales bacterium]|nr:hypothetical protein [Holophagales bacterium]
MTTDVVFAGSVSMRMNSLSTIRSWISKPVSLPERSSQRNSSSVWLIAVTVRPEGAAGPTGPTGPVSG